MAKGEGSSIIEAHIEKAVLGVCVLLLIVAAARWIPSSPRRIPVPEGTGSRMVDVSPGEADEKIVEAAKRMEDRHERQAPPSGKIPAELEAYAAGLETLSRGWTAQRARVALTLPTPEVKLAGDGTEMREGPIKVRLSQIETATPAPGRPMVRAERELPQAPGELADVDIARGVAIFSLNDTLEAWKKTLEGQFLVHQVDVVDVEVQVQEITPGQDWAQASARAVKPVLLPISFGRSGTQGEVKLPIRIPSYDGKNVQQVMSALRLVYELQESILQPTYWPVYGADGAWRDWRWHLPQEPLKELGAQEVESLPMDGSPIVRRSQSPMGPAGAPATPARPGRRAAPGAPPRTGQDAAAEAERMAREMMMPGMPGMPAMPGMASPRTPRGVRRRGRTTGGRGGMPTPPVPGMPGMPGMPGVPGMPGTMAPQTDVDAEPAEKTYEVPPFDRQLADGRVLVWFHDQSIRPGRSYRYRIRLKLRNPLLLHERDLAASARDDGLTTSLNSPWSEWSKPVRVNTATEFFLAGSGGTGLGRGDSSDAKVRIEVFTRSLGQVVKHTFLAGKGEAIGNSKSKKLFNPAWDGRGEDTIERDVDFSTGATIVDVDTDKKVMRNGIPRASVEMVFLDDAGELHTCIVAQHMPPESEVYRRYRELSDELEKVAGSQVAAGR
jgi:hypothetical protein